MNTQRRLFPNIVDPDIYPTILRVALGLVFVFGGIRIGFPEDRAELAVMYTDPATGWIHPFFTEQMTDRLGVSVESFLMVQGFLEIALGLMLIAGLFVPVVAVVVGLSFWAFAVGNPVVGEIRLSRDIALAGLAFALAAAGAGRGSLDAEMRGARAWYEERRHGVLLVIRLSLAFTLISSALFTGGVMDTHLNTTLPVLIVLVLGVLLAAGVAPRWVAAAVTLWMLYIILAGLITRGLLGGIDSTKREMGLLAGALVFSLAGSDRWALWRLGEPEAPPAEPARESVPQ